MIPILYESSETQFVSNGLGRLTDCIKCKVTEQKNGIYECEFQYPVTGAHYEDIQEGRVISVTHDDTQTRQAFDIYSRSAPISGVVTFYARHISYRLRNVIVKPHTSQTAAEAMANLDTYAVNGNPFTFWTDKSTVATFKVEYPVSVKECLVGKQGSIIDVYGGEWEYDNFIIRLRNERGSDKTASIALRQGKNITNITQKVNDGDTYTAVVPYWLSRSDDTVVTLPEGYVTASNAPGYIKAVPLDLSDRWETAPTEAQLREEAVRRLTAAEPWTAKETVEVNFVPLWQTEEYAQYAALQRVNLCDKVSVIYPDLGVNVQKQVIKTIYDVLADRYDKIELGDNVRSLSSIYKSDIQSAIAKEVPTKTSMQGAISYATQLISGGLGGHVVFKQNANGEPEEILIMDTDNINTAVNVLRLNYQGIAFSKDGYDPTKFTTAWTIDGHFVADFIDTGSLNANVIKTGVLMDAKNKNYWNLDTGEISISFDPGSGGAVTQADLQRVETAAQNMANAAQSNAESHADGIVQQLSGSVNATIQGLQTQFANTYATKTELNEAKAGNIILQIPYEYGNGFVNFNAVVYNGLDDVTAKYPNNVFEWFVKSEAQEGLVPIGIGKSISVDTSDAKFGKTIVCRFTAIDDPRYWTDHNGNIITDHQGNPLGFVPVYAMLSAEATVYKQGYTERRFSSLEQTAERFAVELGTKLNETQAQSLIDVTAGQITASVSSTYATKEALSQAIYGDVTLQSPYEYENGIAKFKAVVYRGIDDVTNEYPAGLFRWFLRREDIEDRLYLGTGKTINVDTATAKYGMTVVCHFRLLSEPIAWTDHEGNEITDHDGNVFYFRTIRAELENETNLYQKNYTESRFAALTVSDSEIRAEVSARTEEMVAEIETERQRATGAESTINETLAQHADTLSQHGEDIADAAEQIEVNVREIETAKTSITQTSNGLTAEITRAKDVEATLKTQGDANTSSISTLSERVETAETNIDANADGITAEVTRATAAEETLNTKIDTTADGVRIYADQVSMINDNLIVMSTALFDYVIEGDGSVSVSPTKNWGYVVTDHIPVESETAYTFQAWVEQECRIRYKFAFYGADKGCIYTDPEGSSIYSQVTTHLTRAVTTPQNAKYMRLCYGGYQQDVTKCWAKLEKGSATKYSVSPLDARYSTSKHASLEVTVDGISSTVSEKVGKNEIISSINQTAEEITIQASKINLNGAISGNGNFRIDTDGTMSATNAQFDGYVTGANIIGGQFSTSNRASSAEGSVYIAGDKVYTGGASYLSGLDHPLMQDTLGLGWLTVLDYYGADLTSDNVCSLNIGSTEMFNVVANRVKESSEIYEDLSVDDDDYYNRNHKRINRGANLYCNLHQYGNQYISGTLTVSGKKNREVLTKNYGRVTLNAYETPTPMFGDIGTGKTDENGEAYISIDDIFAETTSLKIEYCVFLQKEGQGDLWVDAKEIDHFVVKGTPNLSFSWELKAVQRDYEMIRLEEMVDATADDPANFEDDALQSDMDAELSSLDELDRDMEQLVRDYDREVMEMEIRNYENLESVSGN